MPDQPLIKHSALINQALVIVSFLERYFSNGIPEPRNLKVALNAFVAQNPDGTVYANNVFINDLHSANNHEWHALKNIYKHTALIKVIAPHQRVIDLFDMNKPCSKIQLNVEVEAFIDAVRNALFPDRPNCAVYRKIQELRAELYTLYSEECLYCRDYSKEGLQRYNKQAVLLKRGKRRTAFAAVTAPVLLAIAMILFASQILPFALPLVAVTFIVAYGVGTSITSSYTPLMNNAAMKSSQYHSSMQQSMSAVFDNAGNIWPISTQPNLMASDDSATSSPVFHSARPGSPVSSYTGTSVYGDDYDNRSDNGENQKKNCVVS